MGLHNLIKDRYFVRTEGIKPKYKTLKPYLKHNFTLEKDSYNLITIGHSVAFACDILSQ